MSSPSTPALNDIKGFFRRVSQSPDQDIEERTSELLQCLSACHEVMERTFATRVLTHLVKTNPKLLSNALTEGVWQTLYEWLLRAKKTNQESLLGPLLETLNVLPVTVELLKQNALAKTVKSCMKLPFPDVQRRAKAVVAKWKAVVTESTKRPPAKATAASKATTTTAKAAAPSAVSSAKRKAVSGNGPSKTARVETAKHLMTEEEMRATGKFILNESPEPTRKAKPTTTRTVPVASRGFASKKHRTAMPFLQSQTRKKPTAMVGAVGRTPSAEIKGAAAPTAPPTSTVTATPSASAMSSNRRLLLSMRKSRRPSKTRSPSQSDQEDLPSPTPLDSASARSTPTLSPPATGPAEASPSKATAAASSVSSTATGGGGGGGGAKPAGPTGATSAAAKQKAVPPKGKKRVHWKPQVAEVRFYELFDEERSSKQAHFRDLAIGEHQLEREAVQSLREQHRIHPDMEWRRPQRLNLTSTDTDAVIERGQESTERDAQLARARITLESHYAPGMSPPSTPSEPDSLPPQQPQEAPAIPIDSVPQAPVETVLEQAEQQHVHEAPATHAQPTQPEATGDMDMGDDLVLDDATLQSIAAALQGPSSSSAASTQPPAATSAPSSVVDPSALWGESRPSPPRRPATRMPVFDPMDQGREYEQPGFGMRTDAGGPLPPRPPPPPPPHSRFAGPPPPPPPRARPPLMQRPGAAPRSPPSPYGHGPPHQGYRDAQAFREGGGRRRREWKPRSEIPCRFFAQGRCAKGSECEFLHDERRR